MKASFLGRLIVVGLCFLGVLGCGESVPKTYPVKGKVTYKNQPLEGAGVTFHPTAGGTLAVGQTDAQGNFALMTFQSGDGAIAGSYAVTITKIAGGPATTVSAGSANDFAASQKASQEMAGKMAQSAKGGRTPAEMATITQVLPVKYSKKETTTLKATVNASGVNDLSFAVEE